MGNLANLSPPSAIVPRLAVIAADGDCHGLALVGNTLFMANGRGGLVVADVQTVTAPVIRTTFNRGFGAGEIVLSGNAAYVGFGGSYRASGPSSNFPVLTAINVANRITPIIGGDGKLE